MQLYSISFTTRKLVKKLDGKGNVIAETVLETPITMTGLPGSTADSYKGCDNFKIWPYVLEDRYRSKGSGRDNSVGNGTKHKHVHSSPVASTPKTITPKPHEHAAAATGDLSAAINR